MSIKPRELVTWISSATPRQPFVDLVAVKEMPTGLVLCRRPGDASDNIYLSPAAEGVSWICGQGLEAREALVASRLLLGVETFSERRIG